MTDQGIPYYTVDAFTDTPFGGNPAAVCLEIDDLSDSAMARIAAEMNLSETAFVYAPDGGGTVHRREAVCANDPGRRPQRGKYLDTGRAGNLSAGPSPA